MTENGENGSDRSGTSESAERGASSLPLFYSSPIPVNKERHAGQSLKRQENHLFARKTNSIPITAAEFLLASKNYPIVFTAAEPVAPVAVVGLHDHRNLYVSDDGAWEYGTYVPAYVRRYPFILAALPGSDKLALCIDEGSGLIEGGMENPFFVEGEPGAPLAEALKFCEEYQRQHAISAAFSAELMKHGLLEAKEVSWKPPSGEALGLSGFQLVSEEKLNSLSDEVFLEWRRKGWLPLVYAHLFSISNMAAICERRLRLGKGSGGTATVGMA